MASWGVRIFGSREKTREKAAKAVPPPLPPTHAPLADPAFRKNVLEWRDRTEVDVSIALEVALKELLHDIDAALNEATFRGLVLNKRKLIATRIEPIVADWQRRLSARLDRRIRDGLDELSREQVAFLSLQQVGRSDRTAGGEYRDIALSGVAVAGGMAAVPVTLMYSAGTATFLGLAVGTTIAWPVVLGGVTLSTILIGTGIWKASSISGKARDGLRNTLREHYVNVLLTGPESYRARVLGEIDRIAAHLLGG